MRLRDTIEETTLKPGEVALFFLAQAGFLIKTADNTRVVVDAYLSDAAERLFGFRRMSPPVLPAEELETDFYLSTHAHVDHLDPDTLRIVVQNHKTRFIGAPDCEAYYKELGIDRRRYVILKTGEVWSEGNVRVKAVYADHGELAPHAVGYLINADGVTFYHTGDTCFCPDDIVPFMDAPVDIMTAPINGQYGNMTAAEACRLAAIIKPSCFIANHFWMFVEHSRHGGEGDPATFLEEAKHLPLSVKAMVMAPGQVLKFSGSTCHTK